MNEDDDVRNRTRMSNEEGSTTITILMHDLLRKGEEEKKIIYLFCTTNGYCLAEASQERKTKLIKRMFIPFLLSLIEKNLFHGMN